MSSERSTRKETLVASGKSATAMGNVAADTDVVPRGDLSGGFRADRMSIDHGEKLAAWMIREGFATGHGDTIEELLEELSWQIKEMRDQLWSYRKAGWASDLTALRTKASPSPTG